LETMIKGAVYYRRWFVPAFAAEAAFHLAARDHFLFWKLLFTRRSLAASVWNLYYTVVPFLVDRLPWFARKPLMNVVLGQEAYYDFPWSDAVSKRFSILNNVTCLKF
jgi:hypothetical protein